MSHGGDQLARGAASAQFEPAKVSEEKWKSVFGEEGMRRLNAMDEKDRQKLIDEAQAAADKVELEPKPVSKTKIRSVQDRIWVTRFEEAEKINGLYVPDEGKEKPAKGIVVAVGPGKYDVNGHFQVPSIAVGDKVVFGKFSGAEVQVGFEHYLVLREDDIFGIEYEQEN